jgi:ABC-type amino acid transport system permease subunit
VEGLVEHRTAVQSPAVNSPSYPATPGRISASMPRPSGRARFVTVRHNLVFLVVPFAAVLLWILGFWGADPRNMCALGLLSLFNAAIVSGLVLLIGGFLYSLYRARPGWVLGTYLVTYIALIHGTPPLLYGTLRYSWAYKHVGIVDYILRTGSVDPSIDVGQIYHNWPGFFAGSALLTSLAGQPDALEIAGWAPLAFNLMSLLVLRYVFRGMTRNRSLVWLGLLFFFLINWVGQEYFSPQALAFVLYLGLIGLLIRQPTHRPHIAPFALIVATLAVSHQITPLMMLFAVSALVATRRARGWYLPLVALVLVATWALTGARDYTLVNLQELVVEFGDPVGNADQTLDKSAALSGTELLVVWGGRFTVIVASAVAILGLVRRTRARDLRVTATVLMVLPALLVLTTGFGGEVLFRAFLFAAPFIAFLAADACLPRGSRGFPPLSLLAATVTAVLVVPGFLLAYYGKERQNYFTPAEVQAAAWVDAHAQPGSLLVEGSTNYPTRFLEYDKFTYVPINREPEGTTTELLADPAGKLEEWLNDPQYTDAYVLLTRGQGIAVDTEASMPVGSVEQIEFALRHSESFRIAFENSDAVVFTLSKPGLK